MLGIYAAPIINESDSCVAKPKHASAWSIAEVASRLCNLRVFDGFCFCFATVYSCKRISFESKRFGSWVIRYGALNAPAQLLWAPPPIKQTRRCVAFMHFECMVGLIFGASHFMTASAGCDHNLLKSAAPRWKLQEPECL